jgi:hypothetical protein
MNTALFLNAAFCDPRCYNRIYISFVIVLR